MKEAIVAYDLNRAIGNDGSLLWEMRDLPADMRHFRELTLGRRVVMGFRTYESIGRPLSKRENIILTRQKRTIPGVTVARSVDEALDYGGDDFACIGGEQIYREFLPHLERVCATEVRCHFAEADAFFPVLDASWHEIARDCYGPDSDNRYRYDFVTYLRSQPEL